MAYNILTNSFALAKKLNQADYDDISLRACDMYPMIGYETIVFSDDGPYKDFYEYLKIKAKERVSIGYTTFKYYLDAITINHPDGMMYLRKLPLLEELHKKLYESQNHETSINLLSEMLWELFQVVPPFRGNAAICTDLLMNYWILEKGLVCSSKENNQIPMDLEAIFSEKDEFQAYFKNLFVISEKREDFISNSNEIHII